MLNVSLAELVLKMKNITEEGGNFHFATVCASGAESQAQTLSLYVQKRFNPISQKGELWVMERDYLNYSSDSEMSFYTTNETPNCVL